MKKTPRDINAKEFIKLLNKKYGYEQTRQSGSHIRLTAKIKGEHHITIPNQSFKIRYTFFDHKDIADYLKISKEQLLDELF